eukprot:11855413-Prorocentrum_lima.AAC.1
MYRGGGVMDEAQVSSGGVCLAKTWAIAASLVVAMKALFMCMPYTHRGFGAGDLNVIEKDSP